MRSDPGRRVAPVGHTGRAGLGDARKSWTSRATGDAKTNYLGLGAENGERDHVVLVL